MENQNKNLWQGGLWEQENPEYPKAPPVVVPPPSKYPKLKKQSTSAPEKLSLGAKLGFAGLLSLIFSLVCLSVVLGHKNSEGFSIDPPTFSDFFGFGEDGKTSIYIDPMDGASLPPTISSCPTDETVTLEFQPIEEVMLTNQEIYAKCLPSIVFIEAKSFYQSATGTGVIMSEDGYIITNAHVIEGAGEAEITLWNNETYDAKLVDYNFEQDLAVLKIEGDEFQPAVFANSDDLVVGDLSYAMGNPLGAKYRSTFTDGMISATDRVLDVDDNSLVFVQTTAAINSGNSGGALINECGQVVGITTIKIMSKDDTIEGMGFAIPSKRVQQVVNRLLSGEEILQAQIGIQVIATKEPVTGIEVRVVNPGSNVEKAGMKSGDIIIEANGKVIRSTADLELVKGYLFVGDMVDYVVYRDGEEVKISAELQRLEE